MQLEHSFTVPVPVDDAWQVLLDVPLIAPCMPGAALTEYDGESFTGTVKVKLGPVGLTYKGTGRFAEKDESAHRVVIEASGRESRGSGTAAATVTASLRPDGDATKVEVTTDLNVTGRPAQFGRGMMAEVSGRLIGQFADCLAGKLQGGGNDGNGGEGSGDSAPAAAAPAGKPTAKPARKAAGAATAKPADKQAAEKPAADKQAPEKPAAGSGGKPSATAQQPAEKSAPRSTAPITSGNGHRAGHAADDVEPIDLLQLSGADELLRRYGPLLAAFAAGGLLVWIATRRRR